MKTIIFLVCLLVVKIVADSEEIYLRNVVLSNGKIMERYVQGKNGNPKYMSGDNLGEVVNGQFEDYIHSQLGDILALKGTEKFRVEREELDFANNKHVFLQQYNRGIKVDGGKVIIHLKANSANVFAVTTSVLADIIPDEVDLSTDYMSMINVAVASAPLSGAFDTTDHAVEHFGLVYLIYEDAGYLAYKVKVQYADLDGIKKEEWLYMNIADGSVILENPLYMNALSRKVYTAGGKSTLPGTLVRSEGQAPSNDQEVNQAYDNSGTCYNFYKNTFNRDSIDGKGKILMSVVHYGKNYNNAFWDGVQMVYGDGDGVQFSDFSGDLSVVCHELTHAVTSYTADLRYQGESGALNEAMSDIMGAASTVFRDGGIQKDTWHIGHDCYLAGTALRYMNNPILDGISYDWYPTRYKGTADNGGVHMNSGIANLAFVLMTQGGVHPQQKSSTWVEDIGISEAQQIFYSALVNYMTETTTFAGARAATETAAKVLFGADSESTVADAWTAVGV